MIDVRGLASCRPPHSFPTRMRLSDTGQLIDLRSGFSVGDIRIELTEMMIVIGALVLMFGLWRVGSRTRLGRAMRAVAVDQSPIVAMSFRLDASCLKALPST
jgi:branched-subunit amino acid ABC-type transport system permease component